jgi:hypothetical protein
MDGWMDGWVDGWMENDSLCGVVVVVFVRMRGDVPFCSFPSAQPRKDKIFEIWWCAKTSTHAIGSSCTYVHRTFFFLKSTDAFFDRRKRTK